MLKAGRAYHAAKAKRNSWPKVRTFASVSVALVGGVLLADIDDWAGAVAHCCHRQPACPCGSR